MLAGFPIREQHFIAADLLELRAARRRNGERAIRESWRQIPARRRSQGDRIAVTLPASGARHAAVIAVERHVMRDEEASRRAGFHLDLQSQLMRGFFYSRANVHFSRLVTIDPAAGPRRHLERRRHAQQVPLAIELDEHPLPMRAKQREVGVHRRQEAIDAHVTLRDHRMEDAVHPDGRGESRFVRRDVNTAAEDVAVWPQHGELFRRQRDVMPVAVEEGEQGALRVAFFVPTFGAEERVERRAVEVERFEQAWIAEKRCGIGAPGLRVCCRLRVRDPRAAGDRDAVRSARHSRLGQRQHRLHLREIRCRRRLPMIRDKQSKEARRRDTLGPEVEQRIAHDRHRMLMLKPLARQLTDDGRRRVARASGKPMQLERIGRERIAFPKRPDREPRIAPIDRLILPRSQHHPALRMRERRVIDVLTDIELDSAAPHRTKRAQRPART